MPYIITVRNEQTGVSAQYRNMKGAFIVSRQAVVTLDEAIITARQLAPDDDRLIESGTYEQRMPLEHGFTVGPLPDGTVVEVELVEWSRLREDIGETGITRSLTDADINDIIDIYNKENM